MYRSDIAAVALLWHEKRNVLNEGLEPVTDYASRRTMMVDTQIRPSDVTKFPVIDAMLSIPRENFVPTGLREAAYVGENLDIGGGRTLIEPRTFAKMLDALDLQRDYVVLDVACGLGYSTAVLANMCDFAVGLEDDTARAEESQSILSQLGIDNAAIMAGSLVEGSVKSAPYDAIILQGGVETVPQVLIDQLREGGRIAAIFVEDSLGIVRIGHKIEGVMTWRFAFNAGAPVLQGFHKSAAFSL